MTIINNAPELGAKDIGAPKPGIGAKIGNALGLACQSILVFCAKICLRILKEIVVCLLAVVGFVAGVIVEAAIDLRWLLIITLTFISILLLWKESMNRSRQLRQYELLHPPVQISR